MTTWILSWTFFGLQSKPSQNNADNTGKDPVLCEIQTAFTHVRKSACFLTGVFCWQLLIFLIAFLLSLYFTILGMVGNTTTNRNSLTCIQFLWPSGKTASPLFRIYYNSTAPALTSLTLSFKLLSFFTHPPTNVSSRWALVTTIIYALSLSMQEQPWATACDFSRVTALICQ